MNETSSFLVFYRSMIPIPRCLFTVCTCSCTSLFSKCEWAPCMKVPICVGTRVHAASAASCPTLCLRLLSWRCRRPPFISGRISEIHLHLSLRTWHKITDVVWNVILINFIVFILSLTVDFNLKFPRKLEPWKVCWVKHCFKQLCVCCAT